MANTRPLSSDELALVTSLALPRHIAIIPDGNRRWAATADKSVDDGHIQGAETVIDIVRAARQIGLENLTIYTFSTENWKRSEHEIDQLMQMTEDYLDRYTEEMSNHGVSLRTIGDLSALPNSLQKMVRRATDKTSKARGLNLFLALNYGGRDEIIRCVKNLVHKAQNNEITLDQINEELISHSLDTSGIPDPDLIIRTSGEQRLSNFLLWQGSYSEIFFEKSRWPEFSPQKFLQAILDYQQRNRRKGA